MGVQNIYQTLTHLLVCCQKSGIPGLASPWPGLGNYPCSHKLRTALSSARPEGAEPAKGLLHRIPGKQTSQNFTTSTTKCSSKTTTTTRQLLQSSSKGSDR